MPVSFEKSLLRDGWPVQGAALVLIRGTAAKPARAVARRVHSANVVERREETGVIVAPFDRPSHGRDARGCAN